MNSCEELSYCLLDNTPYIGLQSPQCLCVANRLLWRSLLRSMAKPPEFLPTFRADTSLRKAFSACHGSSKGRAPSCKWQAHDSWKFRDGGEEGDLMLFVRQLQCCAQHPLCFTMGMALCSALGVNNITIPEYAHWKEFKEVLSVRHAFAVRDKLEAFLLYGVCKADSWCISSIFPGCLIRCEVWGHYRLTAATAASREALAQSYLHILRQISGLRSNSAVSTVVAEYGLMCLPDRWLLREATF